MADRFTPEQEKAYQVRESLYEAFCAGATYALKNTTEMAARPELLTIEQLMALPDGRRDEFERWVTRYLEYAGETLGLLG